MTQPCFAQERLPALLTLLQTTHAEISRYRDYEWKVTAWCLVMIIAAISLPGIGQGGRISPECRTCWRMLLGAFSVVAAVWTGGYIGVLHSRLTWNKVLRRKIEVMLEFCEQNAYGTEALQAPWDSATLLPEAWKRTKPQFMDGISLPLACWLLIAVAESYVLFSIGTMS